jgi:hypothetical protein
MTKEETYKNIHSRIRYLSLFFHEDINEEDLKEIDNLANLKFNGILNNKMYLKVMIDYLDKYKSYL